MSLVDAVRPVRRARRAVVEKSSPWPLVLVSGAVTVPVVGLGVIGPVWPVLALAAGALVGIAVLAPRLLVALALLGIVLSALIQGLVGGVGGYVDEGGVALCAVALTLRRLATEGRVVWLPGAGWFAGYGALGVLSAVGAGVPAGVFVPAAFIAIKGIVLAFAVAQVPWTERDLRFFPRWGAAVVVVVALAGAVNLVLPAPWARLTTGAPPVAFIGPVPALNGLFQHPAAFGRFCGVLAVGALTYLLVVRRTPPASVLLVVPAALAVLTFQVKSLVGMIVTLTVLGLRFVRPGGALVLLCLAPILLGVVGPPLVAYVGADVELYVFQTSARSLLTEGGATVANAYFPWGAGFGRYGSATAADDYSPLYYQLGFDGRYGMGPGADSGQFLNDTQWPALYGEAGWFGAACFALGLVCLAVSLVRSTGPRETVITRWMRITGLGWMLILLVESIAAPVFVSAPSFPFVFIAAGVVAAVRARETAAPVPDDRDPGGAPVGAGPDSDMPVVGASQRLPSESTLPSAG